jgi:hypothetical protein
MNSIEIAIRRDEVSIFLNDIALNIVKNMENVLLFLSAKTLFGMGFVEREREREREREP